MLDSAQIALFLAAAVLLAVTPGPGIFHVAARTLPGGRAEGIASSLGTVHLAAGALGVSALVLASAELFTALKPLGAAYLVWLGVRTIRPARRASHQHLARPREPRGGEVGRGTGRFRRAPRQPALAERTGVGRAFSTLALRSARRTAVRVCRVQTGAWTRWGASSGGPRALTGAAR